MVPQHMSGTVLYPLNELEHVDEYLFDKEVRKYNGRERVMENRIPLLNNCLWNDVLFFSAVHPARFREAFESAGYFRSRGFQAYEFDVDILDHSRMAVLTEMQKDQPKVYEPFDPAKLAEYGSIPDATFDYWRQQHAAKVFKPMLFLHIPHILYRGSLDISLATIVEG